MSALLKDIFAWEARLKEIDALVSPLNEERRKISKKLLEARAQFSVGDIIEWNEGSRRGRVAEITHWCCGRPLYLVIRILKNGKEGSLRPVSVYDFQNPRKVEA